jgi:hypothetical protein
LTIPAFLLLDVIKHLADFTAADPRALVFTGPNGRAVSAEQLHPPVDEGHRCGWPVRFPLPKTFAIPATSWPVKQARSGRSQAIGHAAGTRQEEAIMTATLTISEKSRCLRVRPGGA